MRSREVVRVPSEVLEPFPRVDVPLPVARPVESPVVIYIDRHPEALPEPVRSKVVPWLLIALALVILLFACYAAWHTWLGPQLVPVRPSSQVDLVGPSR